MSKSFRSIMLALLGIVLLFAYINYRNNQRQDSASSILNVFSNGEPNVSPPQSAAAPNHDATTHTEVSTPTPQPLPPRDLNRMNVGTQGFRSDNVASRVEQRMGTHSAIPAQKEVKAYQAESYQRAEKMIQGQIDMAKDPKLKEALKHNLEILKSSKPQ